METSFGLSDGGKRQQVRAGWIYWLVVATLALISAAKPLLDTLDPDSFWHMAVGEQLRQDGIHPLVDRLSFTSNPDPWTPYSWLSELMMRQIWDAGGYRLELLAHMLLVGGIVLLVSAAARAALTDIGSQLSGRILPRVAAIGAAIVYLLPWLTFRPAVMAMCILAMIQWLLARDRAAGEKTRDVWCVIPLTGIAANMHMFVFLAPMWVGALWAGAVWEQVRGIAMGSDGRRRVWRYGWLLTGTILAACATPMLPGLIRTVIFCQFFDPMVASGFIVETQPFYTGRFGKLLVALLVLIAIVLLRGRKRVRMGEWLMLLLGLFLLMEQGRLAPLFALALPVPLTAALYAEYEAPREWLEKPLLLWLLPASVAGALACCVALFPPASMDMSQWVNRNGPQATGYPFGAADYVAARVRPRTGRLINEFNWGGYLAWRLEGKFHVMMDGRTQVRPPEFWHAAVFGTPEEQKALIGPMNADVAILPRDGGVYFRILWEMGWTETYVDDWAVVMVPPLRLADVVSQP